MKTDFVLCFVFLFSTFALSAQDAQPKESEDSIYFNSELEEVIVSARQNGITRLGGVENAIKINKEELTKAACCNLGESFTTNPSVDVNYTDAATGAKQIKLLGLNGTYVQMLTENIPEFRGAATPYALGYVPGPWMNSILVSKGASSVRNGYESITGQIDIEYLKPDAEEGFCFNLYGNSKAKFEFNADGNLHLSPGLSSEILAHFENNFMNHDENDDGFADSPAVRQINLQNRWKYRSNNYIFHAGIGWINENRKSGQIAHGEHYIENPFEISVKTNRINAYLKNAYIFNQQKGTNIALMLSGSIHDAASRYGHKIYDVDEKNLYAQLMFETHFSDMHDLSVGLSLNHDYLNQNFRMHHDQASPLKNLIEKETTSGAYVQYTFKLSNKIIAMTGVRYDYSDIFGSFVTPRVHLKYNPFRILNLRLSTGKGYRTPFVLAENNNLISSGRILVVGDRLQEEAWNMGVSATLNLMLAEHLLKINGEYYYTHFLEQTVVDSDSNPGMIIISGLNGAKSYSHTFQIDASFSIIDGLDFTAAYRFNDVKCTYGGVLRDKPLVSCHKGLFTTTYTTPLGLWQFDATFQLNGSGRMPEPYVTENGTLSWNKKFPTFGQLNLQITRWFRRFSIYIGGENLTNYRQKTPIINASTPWDASFDPTMVWGPTHGTVVYVGIRFNFGNRL